MVFSYLSKFSDKNHFVQTCRTFYFVSNAQLYKDAVSSPGTALHRLFGPQFTGALDIRRDCNHRKSLMNRLLDAGLSVDHECADGRTLLMLAEENNDLLMMGLLLDRGADVNARLDRDKYSRVPVHKSYADSALLNAVYYRRPAAARLLMQYGADLDIVDKFGHTPLTKAVSQNCVGIVEDLLLFGAGVNINTMVGTHLPMTPLHHALDRETYATNPNYLPNPRIVSILLEHGANPNINFWHGWSPLAKVRSRGQRIHPRYRMTLEKVELILLKYGARP
jgi:ankyrin repeat protein